MWIEKKLNSVSLDSLLYKCVKKCCEQHSPSEASQHCPNGKQLISFVNTNAALTNRPLLTTGDAFKLPLHIRQEVVDYLVRERVAVNATFLCDLLREGGVHELDLWTLAEVNDYNANDMSIILNTLAENTSNLKELSIGGSWIYNSRLVNGALQRLLSALSSSKLTSLRIQQTSLQQLLTILESCPNLKRLIISQPSFSDKDVFTIEEQLQTQSSLQFASIRRSLRELHIPSSIRKGGLFKLLHLFPNIQWLKCARFEWLLDALVDDIGSPILPASDEHYSVLRTLNRLRGLTITHPLSRNSVLRIVACCPMVEELSLEVQDGMQLNPIVQLSHLKKLHFHNSPNLSTSFIEQVIPVLQKIGFNLDSLSVEQFDVVDLKDLAYLCPNLKSLSAQWFTIIGCNHSSQQFLTRAEREAVRNRFANLRHIRLRPRVEGTVHPECVKFVLGRAHLIEDIELYCCHNLNDTHIQQLKATNHFKKLKSFILRHGHSVTKKAIRHLTFHSSCLQYIDCGRPTLSKAELVPNDDEDGDGNGNADDEDDDDNGDFDNENFDNEF
ncbi:uncharacterized protein B4U79_16184 [Dinothrombium tinctorium]|uniref:Uncharacterized protein n=1 Tax=Dinothrombium tinctorium TaxID=1965070 RepID=A0A3S3PRD5_9ACAR|nr:uncharacterized protein B4U79_16184 [Dinothrombium tinctorium]